MVQIYSAAHVAVECDAAVQIDADAARPPPAVAETTSPVVAAEATFLVGAVAAMTQFAWTGVGERIASPCLDQVHTYAVLRDREGVVVATVDPDSVVLLNDLDTDVVAVGNYSVVHTVAAAAAVAAAAVPPHVSAGPTVQPYLPIQWDLNKQHTQK